MYPCELLRRFCESGHEVQRPATVELQGTVYGCRAVSGTSGPCHVLADYGSDADTSAVSQKAQEAFSRVPIVADVDDSHYNRPESMCVAIDQDNLENYRIYWRDRGPLSGVFKPA